MSSRRIWIAAIACAALAACNTVNTHIGDEDPAFGEAVEVQCRHPDHQSGAGLRRGARAAGEQRRQGAAAVKRYRTDKVKQLKTDADDQRRHGAGTELRQAGRSKDADA